MQKLQHWSAQSVPTTTALARSFSGQNMPKLGVINRQDADGDKLSEGLDTAMERKRHSKNAAIRAIRTIIYRIE